MSANNNFRLKASWKQEAFCPPHPKFLQASNASGLRFRGVFVSTTTNDKDTTMKLFTLEQYNQLIENGKPANCDKDHVPVVKLFIPGTGCTWLLNEIDQTAPLAFGLCDLNHGFPELGYIDLNELASIETPLGLTVERDEHFTGRYPMSIYAEAARIRRYIVEDDELFQMLATAKRNQFALKL